jgi:hypothetical protein
VLAAAAALMSVAVTVGALGVDDAAGAAGAAPVVVGRGALAQPLLLALTADSSAALAHAGPQPSGPRRSMVDPPQARTAALAEPAAAGTSTGPVGALVGGVVSGVFADLSSGFGQSASALLRQLAAVFVAASTVQLSGAGIDRLVSVTMPIAALVAAVLVIASAASTAWRQDGSPLATSVLGLARAGLICTVLVGVVQVCLRASDDVSSWIVARSFGSDQALAARLGGALDSLGVVGPALMVLVAAIAIVLVLLLWAEMLLRHVAIVLLVATSPVAAAGLVATATASWWPKARSALVQLIVLKPVVVLCLAIGFGEFGAADDLNSVISALITLAAAAFAWPMLARFMTFTTVGAGSGLVASLTASIAGLAASELRAGTRQGAGDQPGSGYALAVERDNDLRLAFRDAAAPAEAAVGGSMVTASLAAARAVGSVASHVGSGVDAMAAHADLAPATSAGVGEHLVPRGEAMPEGPW